MAFETTIIDSKTGQFEKWMKELAAHVDFYFSWDSFLSIKYYGAWNMTMFGQ